MKITTVITKQLETYSQRHPEEVLIISTTDGETEDQVMIFKGFSSSLMHPTDFNPDNSVFSAEAEFVSCDRLKSPYLPNNPIYIAQDLSWDDLQNLLAG